MELLLAGVCALLPWVSLHRGVREGWGGSGFTSDLGGVRNRVLITAAVPSTSAPGAKYLLFFSGTGRNQIRF